jgi:Tol biopolymer transport system component
LVYFVMGQWADIGVAYLVGARGGRSVRIVRNANVYGTAWASDGTRLAVTRYGSRGEVVSVVDLRGRVIRRLAGASPRWSTRDELAVVDNSGGNVLVYDRSGRRRARFSGAAPAWSPDGTQLAYIASGAVWVMGERPPGRRLARAALAPPEWSPNGRSVLYTDGEGRLREISAPRGAQAVRRSPSVSWSPDGFRYAEGGGGIRVHRAGGRTRHVIGSRRADLCSRRFAPIGWTRGGRLVYLATHEGKHPADLWRVPRSGGVVKRLATRNRGWEDSPTPSPDGARLAYELRDIITHADGCVRGQSTRVVVSGRDGETSRVVADPGQVGDGRPAWSPDATKLAFSRSDLSPSLDAGLFVVAAAGGVPRRLTQPLNAFDWWPSWDPGGEEIVFERSGFSSELFIVRAAGGEPRRLTSGSVPAWSPDGSLIAFVRSGDLRVIRPEGSGERVLARVGEGGGSGPPVWSRNGSVAHPGLQGLIVASPATDSHAVVVRVRGISDVAWSADGGTLAFAAPVDAKGVLSHAPSMATELFTVRADGSKIRRLTRDGASVYGIAWQP